MAEILSKAQIKDLEQQTRDKWQELSQGGEVSDAESDILATARQTWLSLDVQPMTEVGFADRLKRKSEDEVKIAEIKLRQARIRHQARLIALGEAEPVVESEGVEIRFEIKSEDKLTQQINSSKRQPNKDQEEVSKPANNSEPWGYTSKVEF